MRTSGSTALLVKPNLHRAGPGGRKKHKKRSQRALSLSLLLAKSRLIGKDPDSGKDYEQEEKGVTEDEIAGEQYQFKGHEFQQTPGDSEGQRGLACCGPWGHQK